MIGLPPAAAIPVVRQPFGVTERPGATLGLATHEPESASRCRLRFRLGGGRPLPLAALVDGDSRAGRRGRPSSPPQAP